MYHEWWKIKIIFSRLKEWVNKNIDISPNKQKSERSERVSLWWNINIFVNEWLKKWKYYLYFEPRVVHWHYSMAPRSFWITLLFDTNCSGKFREVPEGSDKFRCIPVYSDKFLTTFFKRLKDAVGQIHYRASYSFFGENPIFSSNWRVCHILFVK